MNSLLVIICIWLGISVIELPLRLILNDTLISLPTYIYWCLGIIMGYCFWKSRKYLKILVLTITLIIFLTSYKTNNYWLHYFNFGSFTGKTEQTIKNDIMFQSENQEYKYISDYYGQILVLDFWTSSCGACFKAFPEFQELYNEYLKSDKITISSVFCAYLNESGTKGLDIIRKEGYTFPVLSINVSDKLFKELKIDVYPTIVILNQDGTLVFRGNIKSAKKFIKELNIK